MYMDAHNIDGKSENTENLTLTLTKCHTWQKIASQLHMYSCSSLVNQLTYGQHTMKRSSVR